jgi:hypothetical protein
MHNTQPRIPLKVALLLLHFLCCFAKPNLLLCWPGQLLGDPPGGLDGHVCVPVHDAVKVASCPLASGLHNIASAKTSLCHVDTRTQGKKMVKVVLEKQPV